MTLQKCPKCGSSRIRRGYKRTPLPMRLIGIYHLLCDHCNLLFTGFVFPGTLKNHHRRKKHKNDKKSESEKETELPVSSSARVR